MYRTASSALGVLACLLALAGCGEQPAPTPPRAAVAQAPAPPTPPPAVAAAPDPAALLAAPTPTPTPTPKPAPPTCPEPTAEAATEADPLAACHTRLKRFVDACVSGKDAGAQAKDLVLRDPRAWFARVFGADHPRLDAAVAAYEAEVADIGALPAAVRAEHEAGHTELLVERFVHHGDPQATGSQAMALRQMRAPTALYSLRLLAPFFEDAGWHLGSFVCVDGAVRYVGDMEALLTPENREALGALGPMRIETARKLRPDWMTQD